MHLGIPMQKSGTKTLKAGGVKTAACDKVQTFIEVCADKTRHFHKDLETGYLAVHRQRVSFE